MKVLLVNHFPLTGSGSGVYTLNIANSLRKLGNEVRVIFPENQDIKESYNFKISRVFFKSEVGVALDGVLPFNFPCFTTHPRSTFTFEQMTGEQLRIYIDTFRLAIKKQIDEFRPDVIHCGHIWVLASICAEFGVPVVITSHGTDLMGIKKSPNFAKYALDAAKECKAIVSISKGNCKILNEALPKFADKFHLIENGFNEDVFYPCKVSKSKVLKKFGIDKKYKHIVSFAGKFAHFKGIDVLLKANTIYDRGDVATILAGDGELFDDMSRLKEDLGLKNTYFVHNQPHQVLRELYSSADVSLVPSRNEPFGLVAIEAGACGAPIVASKSGGLLDIVTKETGLFFQEENHEELASCVNKILNNFVVFDRKEVANLTRLRFSQDAFTKRLVDEVYLL